MRPSHRHAEPFEKVEPETSADAIRVLSRDRQHVFATTFATPVQRPAGVSDGNVVVMGEAPENEPQQIVSWFEPGSRTGYAFTYHEK